MNRAVVVFALLAAVSLAASGCEQGPEAAPTRAPALEAPLGAPAAAAPPAAARLAFGEPIPPGETVSVAALLAAPALHEGKPVTVEGRVRRVCQQMGCWLELGEPAGTGSGTACRVTFNHAFFVPKDSAGVDARVKGVAHLRSVPADFVKHLEAEGAEVGHKQPDGSAREVTLVASGVELLRGAPGAGAAPPAGP